MDFDFTFGEGTTWNQMVAFEIAGEMWSEYLSDSMTVNIHVEMTDTLPDNVIGGALPAMVADVDYASFRDAYKTNIISWRDEQSFTGLSLKNENGLEQFEAKVNIGTEAFLGDSSNLNMTRANAKALDLIDSHSEELDGYIMMTDLSDTSLNWGDYLNWTGNEKTLDFLSVAVHEVGHILGFVSGIDRAESLYFEDTENLQNYFNDDAQAIADRVDSILDYATSMDMFRYSVDSLVMGENGAIDLSTGTQSYFGKGLYNQFATGKNEAASGDGFQASHWKQRNNEDSVQGIMDPLLRVGATRRVSNRDLKVMDAIGYDISSQGKEIIKTGHESNNALFSDFNMHIGNLEIAAKNNLAQELYAEGKVDSVYWWESDAANYFSGGTQDRTDDVQQMIEQSQVYQARRGGSNYANWQEAYFSEFSWQELSEPISESAGINYVVNTDLSGGTDFQVEADNFESTVDSVAIPTYTVEQTELQLLDSPQQDRAEDSGIDFSLLRNLTIETASSLL